MAEIKNYICDIKGCGKEAMARSKHNGLSNLTVIFTTEQDEGRATKPYLSTVNIDMCQSCFDKMIADKKLITASGAMGYNDYVL